MLLERGFIALVCSTMQYEKKHMFARVMAFSISLAVFTESTLNATRLMYKFLDYDDFRKRINSRNDPRASLPLLRALLTAAAYSIRHHENDMHIYQSSNLFCRYLRFIIL